MRQGRRVRHGPAARPLQATSHERAVRRKAPLHAKQPRSLQVTSTPPRNRCARTGNEPDNDHTRTPPSTQIGRLTYLSLLLADRGMMRDGVIDLPAIEEMVTDAGYRGLVEVEIFAALDGCWWFRPGEDVVRVAKERFRNFV